MPKIKTVAIEKIDVQKLSGDELELLKKFKNSKEFEILKKIAIEAQTRRAFEALEAEDIRIIEFLKGINVGLAFMIDAMERATKELVRRGAEEDIDSEEELK